MNTIAIQTAAAGALSAALPVLLVIVGILLIILVHELGHFVSAKLLGVQVNEFAIGFGPAIAKFQKGETKYAVRLLPLGGFCAMEGENEESDNPRAFGRKKVWRRIVIIAAGAVCNILLGFILALAVFAPQPDFQTTTISGFVKDAKSYETGLRAGDKIMKVNGRRIFTVSDLSYVLGTDGDGKFDMVVRRDKEKVRLGGIRFDTRKAQDGRTEILVDFGVETVKNSFFTTIRESAMRTVSFARIIWMSLLDMITGKIALSEMSGPVGMVQAGAQAASSGVSDMIGFLCIITINLGIFNLLPIPGLDGGRLLFLIVEGIRRKPVPPKYEGLIHAAGLVLLFGLVIVVTFKDIWKLITG